MVRGMCLVKVGDYLETYTAESFYMPTLFVSYGARLHVFIYSIVSFLVLDF